VTLHGRPGFTFKSVADLSAITSALNFHLFDSSIFGFKTMFLWR
jgi:hypothetical protein